MAKIKGREMQTQDNTQCVIKEETKALSVKPLRRLISGK